MSSLFNQYLADLLEEIHTNFEEVKSTFDEEAIHDMRVAIKRLRAISNLIAFVQPQFDVKASIAVYRQIFKSFGRLRDLQISDKLLDETSALPQSRRALSDRLKKEIAVSSDTLRSEYRKSTIDLKSANETFLHELSDVSVDQETANRYLDFLRSKIKISKYRFTIKAWHKKRVNIKFYHHVMDALTAVGMFISNEKEMKTIRIAETLLGDWHDRIVAVEYFSHLQGAEGVVKSLRYQARALRTSSKLYVNQLFI